MLVTYVLNQVEKSSVVRSLGPSWVWVWAYLWVQWVETRLLLKLLRGRRSVYVCMSMYCELASSHSTMNSLLPACWILR